MDELFTPEEIANCDDPWSVTWWDEDGVLISHLYPAKGRRHEMTPNCWCLPERACDRDRFGGRFLDYDHHYEH